VVTAHLILFSSPSINLDHDTPCSTNSAVWIHDIPVVGPFIFAGADVMEQSTEASTLQLLIRVYCGCQPEPMTEIERLKKELAEAKAENDRLRLQLDNVTLLYRQELLAESKLPKAAKE
jgi:hypothetical protein